MIGEMPYLSINEKKYSPSFTSPRVDLDPLPKMATSFFGIAASVMLLSLVVIGTSDAQLTTSYYAKSCPQLLPTVRSVVQSAINKETRMGASLLRLFFHDCFVNGCDGSILLDGRTNEKFAAANFQSARGFEVIDNIKSAVEKVCPGVVSCADILAITARDSVVTLGGPNWGVKLGRRDARTASQAAANSSIPSPAFNLNQLITSFANQGLSMTDMVALAGGHTIGQARCVSFRSHIYNDTDINASFAQTRKRTCPATSGNGDNNLAPLDLQTPTKFDNGYFKNLVVNKGLLHSDQELFSGGSSSAAIVRKYSTGAASFGSDFVAAMIKMGDIKPLTGKNGEIRKNCRRAN